MESMLTRFLREGTISFSTLLLKCYRDLGLTDKQMMLIIHILSFKQEGKDFPTVAELSSRMSADTEEIVQMLQYLVKHLYLEIEEGMDDRDGIRYESYSLEPLYKRISRKLEEERRDQQKQKEEKKWDHLYALFEEEFGRPLSPLECEQMAMWVDEDGHSEELIKAALKEAVISGKLFFKYIDRILFEWQRNQIRTPEQAKAYALKFRRKQRLPQAGKSGSEGTQAANDFPFYNWLEEE